MNEPTESKPAGPGAEAVKVSEFENYEPGSVVSREIIRKPTGTVTLFAFDEGGGLSEHTAPLDAPGHVPGGEVEIRIAGRPVAHLARRRNDSPALASASRAACGEALQDAFDDDPVLNLPSES